MWTQPGTDALQVSYSEDVAPPHRRLLLFAGFCLALLLMFFFGYRAGRRAHLIRWANEPIRPWMSVPFIAHVHHVPSETLFRAIGVEPHRHDRRPLRQIAREQHRPLPDLMREVERAIAGQKQPRRGP